MIGCLCNLFECFFVEFRGSEILDINFVKESLFLMCDLEVVGID